MISVELNEDNHNLVTNGSSQYFVIVLPNYEHGFIKIKWDRELYDVKEVEDGEANV